MPHLPSLKKSPAVAFCSFALAVVCALPPVPMPGQPTASATPAEVPPTYTGVVDRWVAQDALDPLAPGAVLFVGSSSIRRWEILARDFADYRVIQRGEGGSQFTFWHPIVDKVVTPHEPSAIVVFCGINDIFNKKTGETVFGHFKIFVEKVRAKLPKVPVCYIAINPAPAFFDDAVRNPSRVTANTLIRNFCESDPALNLHYFATDEYFEKLRLTDAAAWRAAFPDNIHLTRAGYAHWHAHMRAALARIVPPNKVYVKNNDALRPGERLFFDFGPSQPSVGDPTTGPDANGNHWNNWHPTNGGGLINSGEHLGNLVSATGRGTGIRMTITGGFQCNGKAPFGGLVKPDAKLLGEFAVETATQDFFFSHSDDDDLPGSFMLEGLDPALAYEFRFLGSRDSTETRITKITVAGANEKTASHQTSGAGLGAAGGNGNDHAIAVLGGIRPDQFGQIFVDVTRQQGAFTYLNAMEIRAVAVP